ncbi:MAG: bifunctional 23S rRNA (guanine(2069)-N(7))-methyltransferase RlmK/23S rRNA (guanine(2445)-N(2))-methyltransferase RlmL [Gammaproteobacteria bacterium]|nr:bifunctional 23S rRNA (guanine(2069)-N(7))-methyltransferase RlmK/23S rRNA (guanine(2445)-N(2))-methyltransferase RlmL [Gammaproteobacteria bacterium]
MTQTYQFFATCPKGVEDMLTFECQELRLSEIKPQVAGVAFEGEVSDAYKLCLWSRLASRVLLRLSSFTPGDYDDLYQGVKQVDWLAHFDVDKSFAIDCFAAHEEITNSHFATLRIKDAIVDQFVERLDVRPNVARDNPDIRINVYIGKTETLVYLDLSGEPLHQRGYRQKTGVAPLKENLAAAILLRCKWPQLAEQGMPLCDPMCGSGTLLIEAAYIAANIAPGILRKRYGFTAWKQHDVKIWEQLYDEARQLAKDKSTLPVIIGADNSKNVLDVARDNIMAAGLSDFIRLYQQDVSEPIADLPATKGLLVTNPPYGQRLGQVEQLKNIYYRIGQALKNNYAGWEAAVFTSSPELARFTGLRSHHKNTLYNGAIKCVLNHYHVREIDPSRIKESSESEAEQKNRHESADMFENRLKKNFKHIRKWARKNNISCYRVYDADIPQYSMAVDIYENWVHVQEYEAPKTVDAVKAFRRINEALPVIASVLEIDPNHVVLKTRKIQSGSEQYVKQDDKKRWLIAHEHGLKFKVNLYDYLDTGLFLDHRNARQLIFKYAKGRSFLNLFAYTGTATVYAAAGGARSTTTVDMSNTYLEWAQENLKLNKLVGRNHQFLQADCTQWLWDAKRAGHRYQLIFLDPPTFSNSKKMTQTFDVLRDHVELINLTMKLLEDEGMLIFSCNAKKFKLDVASLSDYFIEDITAITVSEDFRKKPKHKCWCISKQKIAPLKL